jgi:hypothetical protein
MNRQEMLHKYFLSSLFLLSILHCTSEHNTVRLYPAKGEKAAYRQLSTDHYLYVDGNHVAEAERGERRVLLVLRSKESNTAKLYIRLKVYPEDDVTGIRAELRLAEQVLRPVLREVRREPIAEQVTILESGDSLRTNPMIGNDVQAQSGYITFGKPTGAGAAKRYWQLVILEAELDTETLALIARTNTLAMEFSGNNIRASADFSRRQLAAWQRFSLGMSDEEAKD